MKRFVLMLFIFTVISIPLCSILTAQKVCSVSLSYDVRNMTIILNDKKVPFYIVYDSISGKLKSDFVQVGGSVDLKKSIQKYGEKHRKGILIFNKRIGNENVKNK